MKKIVLLIAVVTLSGCASYLKRKSCESINWFEHGKEVALRGQWLNSDSTVQECRKVEADVSETQLDLGFKSGVAKYCSLDQAYQVGKEGDFFSRDLCEGPQINPLLAAHKKGVHDYCAKANGQQAGASGKKYQNICPKDLESAFLKEYRKGRQRYVKAMIEAKQNEISANDLKISQLRGPIMFKEGRLFSMKNEISNLEVQRNSLTDFSLRTNLDSRISSLRSDIMTLDNEISSQKRQIDELESANQAKNREISAFKAELPSLEN